MSTEVPPYIAALGEVTDRAVAAIDDANIAALEAIRTFIRVRYPTVRTVHIVPSDQGNYFYLGEGNAHEDDPVEIEDEYGLAGEIFTDSDGDVWFPTTGRWSHLAECEKCHGMSMELTIDN
jgi:hypothetical protein